MGFLIKFFLYLGFFTTPFYIFSSGSIQPSHIFFLTFSFLWIVFRKGLFINSFLLKITIPFIIYVSVVNVIYAFIYQDVVFLNYPINLIFDYLIMYSLFSYLDYYKKYLSLNSVYYLMFALLLTLFIYWVLGFGDYKFYPRYNGFFNDPNQMAFFVLCVVSIASLFANNISKLVLVSLLSLILIFVTQSRSALLGVFLIIISILFYTNQYQKMNNFYLNFIVITICSSIVIYLGSAYIDPQYLGLVFDRFSNTDVGDQADIRGYTRLTDYKEYLLFGAGQGLDTRFNAVNEVHSTWAAILFYYGIFGFVLFITIIYNIFKNLNFYQKIIFLAPLIYSFSTFGARTIIFWIFLAFFAFISRTELSK